MTLLEIKKEYKELLEKLKNIDKLYELKQQKTKELDLLKDTLTYSQFREKEMKLNKEFPFVDKWKLINDFKVLLRENIHLFADMVSEVIVDCYNCKHNPVVDIYIKNGEAFAENGLIDSWIHKLENEYTKGE